MSVAHDRGGKVAPGIGLSARATALNREPNSAEVYVHVDFLSFAQSADCSRVLLDLPWDTYNAPAPWPGTCRVLYQLAYRCRL